MPHYVPYLLLVAATVAWLFYVSCIRKRTEIPVLLLVYSGMIYLFEFVVLLLLSSYEYDPEIIPIRYYDNVMGSLASNLIAVPAAAVTIAAYRLRLPHIAAIIALFAGIELLFMLLGIYHHHWWRVEYTSVSMLVFFYLARWWLAALTAGRRLLQLVSTLMFAWCLSANVNYACALIGLRRFHAGVFADPYREDMFVSGIYAFIVALIIAVLTFYTTGWKWRAAALLLSLGVPVAFLAGGLLKLYVPVWVCGMLFLFVYAAIIGLTEAALRQWRRLARAQREGG